MKIPSFGVWLSRQTLFFQVNFGPIMKVILPILIICFGWFYLYIFVGMSIEFAFALPGLVAMMISGTYWGWELNTKGKSHNVIPLNHTIAWSNTEVTEDITNIQNFEVLLEDKEKKLFIYSAELNIPSKDQHNVEYTDCLFLSQYNWGEMMREVPGQIVAFMGTVQMGFAARVVSTYLSEYGDIKLGKDVDFGKYKIFRVDWCPEDGRTNQIAAGMIPEDVDEKREGKDLTLDKSTVTKAAQLEIDRKAMHLARINRDLVGDLQIINETNKPSRERAYKDVKRLFDDEDDVRARMRGAIFHNKYVVAAILIGFSVFGLYYTKILGWW